MVQAKFKGKIIAQSNSVIEFKGQTYFPRNSIMEEFFRESPDKSECFYRGTAKYWDLIVDGQLIANGASSYESPRAEEIQKIKNMILFNEEVDVY